MTAWRHPSPADTPPRCRPLPARADAPRRRSPVVGARARRRPSLAAVVVDASGQATVELIALLPLLLIAALAGAALLAAQAAGEEAGEAAEAGAVALLRGGDPREAARRALPEHARAQIAVAGRRVTVTVLPHLPLAGLERRLAAHATATAGPEPAP
jgi:hypothetical protein